MAFGNVLITSASAKAILVQNFREAMREFGGQVFTADSEPACAAGFFADKAFQVPKLREEGALDKLLSLVRDNGIKLIVPTRDGELPFFAANRTFFEVEGARILVPGPDRLEVVQDKAKFADAIEAAGIPAVPRIYPPFSDDTYPIFVRPITGAGGIGARSIRTAEDFEAIEDKDRLLFHPFIHSREYTIDLLMAVDEPKAIQAIARERKVVVAGESKVSKVVDRPRLVDLTLKLGETLGLVGHNTVQAFDDDVNGTQFIEVNPRFGGASNLSIQAGLDSPRRILQMLAGDTEAAYAPRPVRIGATMYRYQQDVIVDEAPDV